MNETSGTSRCRSVAARVVAAMGLLLGWAGGGHAAQRTGNFSDLLANSPFGGGKPEVPPAADPALEFRGYVYSGEEALFNVVVPGTEGRRRNTWVEIGQSGGDYVVRSFDRDTDTLRVDYHGRELALRLKTNRVQLLVPEKKPSAEEIAAAEGRERRTQAARAIRQSQARRVAEAREAQTEG